MLCCRLCLPSLCNRHFLKVSNMPTFCWSWRQNPQWSSEVLEDHLHRYSVGIILTPAPAYSAIVRRSCCHMLMNDHFNSRHVRAIPWHSERWRARRRIDTGPTGKAGVKNRHTPIKNYAGFLKFGTHHRALQKTHVFRKKPASVRQWPVSETSLRQKTGIPGLMRTAETRDCGRALSLSSVHFMIDQ